MYSIVNTFFPISSDVIMPKYILEDIVGKEGENNLLNASEGTEFDSSLNKTMSTEEQKKRLNAEMGLDVASKLGICQDLVGNEDLESTTGTENLSAREKNVRKRQKRKLAKAREESTEKKRIAAMAYSINDEQKESLGLSM